MSHITNDRLLLNGLRICALLCAAIVIGIVVLLISESLPVAEHVGWSHFWTDSAWHPALENGAAVFNLMPMLFASILAAAGAVAIAGPLGILSAVFCHYYCSGKTGTIYRRIIEILAGIPSVVFGLWGLVVLVPLINKFAPPGASLLAGIFILTAMILPTMALASDAALGQVPHTFIHASAALGLGRWATIRQVALPVARSGIFTGFLLQSGRALGETMAILMVCGNIVQLPGSIFDPVRTLTANMALEMAYATGDHRSALFTTGLFLMLLVVMLVLSAEFMSKEKIYG